MAPPEDWVARFGERLRRLRRTRGWTQEELARRTKRHWTYIGGLEREERNPTLVVMCEVAAAFDVSPSELLAEPHAICGKLNASASDVLEAIDKGFRAQIDVKGKLAELYMNRQLEGLQSRGAIRGLVWQDLDGRPDFVLTYRSRQVVIECKNIRNEVFVRPPSYKVELQRTRNSMDGTPTRGYKGDEFDVLGVSLFNQTSQWAYLYIATKHLSRRPDMPNYLTVMQRVPKAESDVWVTDPLRAFDQVLEDK